MSEQEQKPVVLVEWVNFGFSRARALWNGTDVTIQMCRDGQSGWSHGGEPGPLTANELAKALVAEREAHEQTRGEVERLKEQCGETEGAEDLRVAIADALSELAAITPDPDNAHNSIEHWTATPNEADRECMRMAYGILSLHEQGYISRIRAERDLLRAQLADVTAERERLERVVKARTILHDGQPVSQGAFNSLLCQNARLESQAVRLRNEALRFYFPDGSYQVLDTPEQVVELRKAAAAQNAFERARHADTLAALERMVHKCRRYLEERGPSESEQYDPDYVEPLHQAVAAITQGRERWEAKS
jgi:hypothetical protein